MRKMHNLIHPTFFNQLKEAQLYHNSERKRKNAGKTLCKIPTLYNITVKSPELTYQPAISVCTLPALLFFFLY